MATAVNSTDAHHLDISGVHLLPSLAVLTPGACGVSITLAPGRGRSALVMVHDDRRATRPIDVPLAGRLGMAQITWELEDMAFKDLEPEAYWWLVEQIAEQRPRRERYVREAGELLRTELLAHGVQAEVTGRAKHLYSIYRKLLRPEIHMDLQRVYDLFALRVLVDTLPACYQALGQVHALWTPVTGRFKDYIAMPKPNGYQSLHTTVIGPEGRQLEVQIRTHEMHRLAEYGLAAHLFYKEEGLFYKEEGLGILTWRVVPWPRHTDVAGRGPGDWPLSHTHAVSHTWYSPIKTPAPSDRG
jgi:Region found in RelA / SpoT proteins